MGTKNNPGEFDCYANADRDEPLFVLRAKDKSAPDVVRHWAYQYKLRKEQANGKGKGDGPQPLTPDQRRKYLEALDCADQMAEWYNLNREE